MGQKVNPVGFRLGVNRGWDSVWYAKKKDFGNYLIEDFKIRAYIKKNVVNSGVSKVMIERTSNKCFVTIYTSRPGFVIGKKGSDIDKIKNNLSKFTNNEVTLNIKEGNGWRSSMATTHSEQFKATEIDRFVAIVSYITLVGWFIAIVMHGKHKSPLASFHLRQSLGLIITGALLILIPLIGWLTALVLGVFWCIALFHACKGEMYLVPWLGKLYQDELHFIAKS